MINKLCLTCMIILCSLTFNSCSKTDDVFNAPVDENTTPQADDINLNDKNTARNATARLSADIDLSKEDRVPDLLFSEIIWKAVKGEDSEMPAPRRSAFVNVADDDDEEEGDGDDKEDEEKREKSVKKEKSNQKKARDREKSPGKSSNK